MAFTVTHPLARPPTFPELKALAGQHEVQIDGNELAGAFFHPGREQPRAKGNYAIEPSGEVRGDFTGQAFGKLSGTFLFGTGKAEITITEKPILIPEAMLKSKLTEALGEFCDRFPPA